VLALGNRRSANCKVLLSSSIRIVAEYPGEYLFKMRLQCITLVLWQLRMLGLVLCAVLSGI